ADQAAGAEDWAARIAVLDPLRDIPPKLAMRITSASRAVKPYRFLEPELRAHDDADKIRVAMQRRRDELPQAYAAMGRFFNWSEPEGVGELIARPASPERAQLMQAMISSGLREFELFNWQGLDLSFAWAPDTDLLGVSMQGGKLAYAVFDRGQIRGSDFRGTSVENVSFRKSVLIDSDFSRLPAPDASGPYRADEGEYPTTLAGSDLTGALILDTSFAGAAAAATRFDGAVLSGVDFTGTALGSASFRDAVILGATFDAAGLQSVEFDGALVFAEDFLDHLDAVAAPGSFRRARFVQEAASIEDDVMANPVAFANFGPEAIREVSGSDRVWRLRRVEPFETPAPADTPPAD
ncbi:MAG: pentapeptide repeat-containing protein, partial [Rhodobacteraceae bacterium]|nr:pentapeptide repeat-containing protein [Paracoccaceae bacterium]